MVIDPAGVPWFSPSFWDLDEIVHTYADTRMATSEPSKSFSGIWLSAFAAHRYQFFFDTLNSRLSRLRPIDVNITKTSMAVDSAGDGNHWSELWSLPSLGISYWRFSYGRPLSSPRKPRSPLLWIWTLPHRTSRAPLSTQRMQYPRAKPKQMPKQMPFGPPHS